MCCQIIQYDNITLNKNSCKRRLNIKVKTCPTHRTVKHPWRIKPITGQSGDESLAQPMSKGCIHDQALALFPQPCVRTILVFTRCLVNKIKAARHTSVSWQLGDACAKSISPLRHQNNYAQGRLKFLYSWAPHAWEKPKYKKSRLWYPPVQKYCWKSVLKWHLLEL